MATASTLTVADKATIAVPEFTTEALDQAAQSPETVAKANEIATKLLTLDPSKVDQVAAAKTSIESMGASLATRAASESKMLEQPLKALMQRGEDGGEVAKSLIDLKMQVEELDPARFDFESGMLMRIIGKVPGLGSPVKRYFTRYQSAGAVIENIISSLEKGREQLKRDNVTLLDDQKRMRALTLQLQQAIAIMKALDVRLTEALDQEIPADDPRHKFLSEEILFPLRQVIMDRQQNLLVNQQGVLTMEMIIRNNKELIRGVSRSCDVTVNALRIAVTLAVALANQRIVLDKINAVNKTTESLLAGNAERLKTQGAEINKQASSAQLNIEVLGKAFADIREALDDVSRFRQEALPRMAQDIISMERMTADQEDEIKKLEHATKAKAALKTGSSGSGDFLIDISE